MKTMTKKLGAIVLALALCLSLCCTALAASSPTTQGSITITNAEIGETYTIYQIFDLTYDEEPVTENTTYSYKVVDSWKTFISNYTYTNINGEVVNLFDLDDNGYLKVTSNVFSEQDNSEVMAAFAQEALKYATDPYTNIQNSGSMDAISTSVTFSNLKLGYYLVDTTLGSLCFLDSTNPSVSIAEKNTPPWPEKEVYDEETDDEYTDKDTAEVGDTLSYEIFLHDVAHSVNLCMHDTLTDGLTFSTGSVKVYVGYPDESVTDLFNDDTTNWTPLTADEQYTESDSCSDGCIFELKFDDTWLNSLSEGAVIKVEYKAVVNENAIVDDVLWSEQHNDVYLTYASNGTSTHGEADTDTFGFEIVKYTGNNTSNVLNGAEFELYRDSAHTDQVSFVAIYDDDNNIVGYEEVDPDKHVGGSITTTITAGSVYVKGLHEGIYYLTETKAPDGYNMLQSDVVVTITATRDGNNKVTGETITYSYRYNDQTQNGTGTVYIQNNTGTELPGTGGIGTTIFYIIGGVLVAGAVVVLVTRRRMTREG